MYRWKWITRYYSIEQRGDTIYVSHFPKQIFYYADKHHFFEQRKEAYQTLAAHLRNEEFWSSAKVVMSRSLIIDFARETEQSERVKSNLFDKMGLLFLWMTNVHNWRPKRVVKVFRYLFQKRISMFQMDRSSFITHFESR